MTEAVGTDESKESYHRSINVRQAFIEAARDNGCNIQDMVACAMTLIVELTQASWPDDKDGQHNAIDGVCRGLKHTISLVEIYGGDGPKGPVN
jgi:hypothetical protein